MKTRRHHNNDGRRRIQRGKTRMQVERMARRLGVPYGEATCDDCGAVLKAGHYQTVDRLLYQQTHWSQAEDETVTICDHCAGRSPEQDDDDRALARLTDEERARV